MTKPGFTRAEHVDIGLRLQEIIEALLDVTLALAVAYPVRSAPFQRGHAALKVVDELRSSLDDASASELDGDRWSAHIYFASNRAERQAWLDEHPITDADR